MMMASLQFFAMQIVIDVFLSILFCFNHDRNDILQKVRTSSSSVFHIANPIVLIKRRTAQRLVCWPGMFEYCYDQLYGISIVTYVKYCSWYISFRICPKPCHIHLHELALPNNSSAESVDERRRP